MPPSKRLFSDGTLSSKAKLTIDVINVGQGNCVLVSFPNGEFMLVDAGSQTTSTSGKPFKHAQSYISSVTGGKNIVCVVLSHGDDDHTAFIPHIDEAQSPTYVHFGGSIGDYSQAVQAWIHSMENKKGRFVFRYPLDGYFNLNPDADFGSDTDDGEAHISVLAANAGFTPNDCSIVLMVRYGNQVVILPGDAEQYAESLIISKVPRKVLVNCSLLVPGHHGAFESTGVEWAKTLQPDVAAISASGDNLGYAHPNKATVDLLIKHVSGDAVDHTVTYSEGKGQGYQTSDIEDALAVTATNGDIRFITDGSIIRVLASSLLSSVAFEEVELTSTASHTDAEQYGYGDSQSAVSAADL
jgi:competence protein ComEC